MVYVKDLADQILDKTRAGEFLYCPVCGDESSANKGDYFMADDNQKLRCGNHRPLADLVLATRTSTINVVKG